MYCPLCKTTTSENMGHSCTVVENAIGRATTGSMGLPVETVDALRAERDRLLLQVGELQKILQVAFDEMSHHANEDGCWGWCQKCKVKAFLAVKRNHVTDTCCPTCRNGGNCAICECHIGKPECFCGPRHNEFCPLHPNRR